MIWRLRNHCKISPYEEKVIEKKAAKFVALTFFVLGFYVLFESVETLITQKIVEPALPYIIIAFLSAILMLLLAYKKHDLGQKIKSKALIVDSKEKLACFWLSVALLLGLSFNYLIGFWQADPLAGLIIVYFLFIEGWDGLNESTEMML